MGTGAEAAGEWVNEVHLVGRVSSEPEERELPSGDVVVLFRLVVPRPAPDRKQPGAAKAASATAAAKAASATAAATAPPKATPATQTGPVRVDTMDIACWARRARSSAVRLRPGDHAEVSGALRRRFFRAGGVAASRYEVDATAVRRRYRPAAV